MHNKQIIEDKHTKIQQFHTQYTQLLRKHEPQKTIGQNTTFQTEVINKRKKILSTSETNFNIGRTSHVHPRRAPAT